MHPDDLFRCVALHCTVRHRVCIRRQIQAETEILGAKTTRACHRRADPNRRRELSRHDGKRGAPSSEFAMCLHCPQGAAIREELGDEVAKSVRSGLRSVADLLAYRDAERARTQSEIPTIDSHLRRD